MKKKTLSIVLALAVTLGLSFMAMARSAPVGGTVNIDEITIGDFTQAELETGLEYYVDGYVEFDSAKDGPKLETLTLAVKQDDSKNWTTIDFQDYGEGLGSDELDDRSNVWGSEFDFESPWTIETEGTYEVRVTATFVGSYAKAKATTTVEVTLDEEEEEDLFEDEDAVEDEEEEESNDTDRESTLDEDSHNFPAAPAIANKILKEDLIKNHYGKGKDGGNYISEIAKEMGKNGELRKDQFEDREEYEEAVEDYLQKMIDAQADEEE